MKTLIWTLFAVIAGMWTATAAFTTWALRAMSDAIVDGTATDLESWVLVWTLPNWLVDLLGAQWVQAAQMLIAEWLEALPRAWPLVAESIGWLVPVVWVLWAVAMLALLAGAIGLHVLVSSTTSSAPSAARLPT